MLKNLGKRPLKQHRLNLYHHNHYNKLETFFSSHAQLFNQSEDCLYLNIWCQNNQYKNKPVIIYFMVVAL